MSKRRREEETPQHPLGLLGVVPDDVICVILTLADIRGTCHMRSVSKHAFTYLATRFDLYTLVIRENILRTVNLWGGAEHANWTRLAKILDWVTREKDSSSKSMSYAAVIYRLITLAHVAIYMDSHCFGDMFILGPYYHTLVRREPIEVYEFGLPVTSTTTNHTFWIKYDHSQSLVIRAIRIYTKAAPSAIFIGRPSLMDDNSPFMAKLDVPSCDDDDASTIQCRSEALLRMWPDPYPPSNSVEVLGRVTNTLNLTQKIHGTAPQILTFLESLF